MGDNYGYPEKRRTKRDLKKKRKYRAYKKGGKFRSSKVEETREKK